MIKIVEELKNYCIARFLYQKEIADKLKVSQATISLWFKGKITPDIKQQYKIKKLLEEETEKKTS